MSSRSPAGPRIAERLVGDYGQDATVADEDIEQRGQRGPGGPGRGGGIGLLLEAQHLLADPVRERVEDLADTGARQQRYQELVAEYDEKGKALSTRPRSRSTTSSIPRGPVTC